MSFYFLDTSALVKRYIQETGTGWVQSLTDPASGHYIYIARITEVELTAALARRRTGGSLPPGQATAALQQFRSDLQQEYRIAEVTTPLLRRAADLADRHQLRTYDAVQLAVALELHSAEPTISCISADAELNAAAQGEGMIVDDPNLHP